MTIMRKLGCVLLCVLIGVTADVTEYAASRLHITNTSRYEACPFLALHSYSYACYRAQPLKTERILRYTEATLPTLTDLANLAGQTIFFVGDSLTRNQFTALACFLWTSDPSISETHLFVGDDVRVQKITSQQYDLELLFTFTGTLFDIQETKLPLVYTNLRSLNLFPCIREVVTTNSSVQFRTPTIIVISAGHHYDLSKYSNESSTHGQVIDLQLYELAMRRVATLLRQLLRSVSASIRVIFRAVPPRHYVHGDWNTGGRCEQEQPCPQHYVHAEIARNNSNYWKANALSDILKKIAQENRFDYLNILPEALHRCDGMVGTSNSGLQGGKISDCSHYCVPGVPDVWNTFLINHILARRPNKLGALG